MKRFTASLEPHACVTLHHVAQSQRPPISLQHVLWYSLEEFLNRGEGHPLTHKFRTDHQK